MTEKQIVAFHEAGHAVAMIKLDLTFRWASVRNRGLSAGRISGAPRGVKRIYSLQAGQEVPPDLAALGVACIISTLTGPYAEMRVNGGQLLSPYSAQDDLELAADLCSRIGLGTELFSSHIVPEAHRLLERYWPAVKSVAWALDDRSPRALSYRQVAEIVRTA